jgi:serine protease
MHRAEPAAPGPSRSNRWSSRYWLVGALAAGLAFAPPAAGEEAPPGPPEQATEPTAVAVADAPSEPASGELAEAAWDVPGQLLIDARDELSEAEALGLASAFGLHVAPTDLFAETRIQLADVPAGEEASWMERLRGDERVEGVEPLAKVRAFFSPNDPLLKDQWHLTRIGAERAWDFATGRGVVVAVVDTGIACEERRALLERLTDLAATRCVSGWSFVTNDTRASDDQGHGTHVAGTIAQSTNNGLGAAGVAFDASLMPVKVLNEHGWGTTADVADGIRWAADHGAHVINLSLGGPRNSQILQKAIDHAVARGVVVVAAAGNTGGRVQFPGASDGVIGVSATDSKDKLAYFSSRGDGVDLAAPGVNVLQQTICNRGATSASASRATTAPPWPRPTSPAPPLPW